MPRTRIKICGITRVEDAVLAASLGAHAIGMIFHTPSRRNISIDRAWEIVRSLPPFVTPVGVFVDAPVAQIVEIAREVHLQLIQLHGKESPSHAEELAGHNLPCTKALKVDDTLAMQVEIWKSAPIQGLVLETPSDAPGGTGKPNDFPGIARHQAEGLFGALPLIIAGGLTPQTVSAVIQSLRPHAVDVSSGVEEIPGQKSQAKLQAFFKAVSTARSRLAWLE